MDAPKLTAVFEGFDQTVDVVARFAARTALKYCEPERIILFGSRGRGDHRDEWGVWDKSQPPRIGNLKPPSDYDIAVILPGVVSDSEKESIMDKINAELDAKGVGHDENGIWMDVFVWDEEDARSGALSKNVVSGTHKVVWKK